MILVSGCLLGINCKYNGGNNLNESVKKFLDGKEYTAICPETMGGLKSPRLPCEIRENTVFSADGTDLTKAFTMGAKAVCAIAQEKKCELAILKEGSPSCGCHFIYDGTFTHVLKPGMGITAEMLFKQGISVKSEKDIEKQENL